MPGMTEAINAYNNWLRSNINASDYGPGLLAARDAWISANPNLPVSSYKPDPSQIGTQSQLQWMARNQQGLPTNGAFPFESGLSVWDQVKNTGLANPAFIPATLAPGVSNEQAALNYLQSNPANWQRLQNQSNDYFSQIESYAQGLTPGAIAPQFNYVPNNPTVTTPSAPAPSSPNTTVPIQQSITPQNTNYFQYVAQQPAQNLIPQNTLAGANPSVPNYFPLPSYNKSAKTNAGNNLPNAFNYMNFLGKSNRRPQNTQMMDWNRTSFAR